VLIDVLPSFLERTLARYRTELIAPPGELPAPSLKLDVFVLRDREQWASLTRRVMGGDAPPFESIPRGGFSSGGRSLLWNIGLRDTLALAAHEGWHQYTQRTFRDALPLWLDEGLATYFEGLRLDPLADRVIAAGPWANVERFSALRAASDRSLLLPLSRLVDVSPEELLTMPQDRALAYYAQVWALTLFLAQTHRAQLSSILNDASRGSLAARVTQGATPDEVRRWRDRRTGAGVARACLASNLDEMGVRYASFIADMLAPGAMERVARGESPLSRE
jgi:hypothetical protein